MITDLEPDILECEVKWALGSITTKKASRRDGIPVELFQILKDDAVKVLHSIRQQIWKTQQSLQDWKRLVFIPIPKKDNARECSNYCTIALDSHASKAMLKILQARLQHCVNWELPDVQSGFRKRQRNQRSNCQHPLDHSVDHNKLWKILRDVNTRSPYLPPEKSVCRSRSNSYNQTWNNVLVQNWQGSTSRLYIITLLIYLHGEYRMQNSGLDEAQAGIKIAGENINNLR